MSTDRPFLDTNIILRHLTGDHPEQSPASKALIAALEAGEAEVWTTHLVVAEAVFVLGRVYSFERQRIADTLLPIIELPGIRLPRKRLFRRVFELFTSLSLSFVDCYHAALVEKSGSRAVLSYDAGFDRVEGIDRREPRPATGP